MSHPCGSSPLSRKTDQSENSDTPLRPARGCFPLPARLPHVWTAQVRPYFAGSVAVHLLSGDSLLFATQMPGFSAPRLRARGHPQRSGIRPTYCCIVRPRARYRPCRQAGGGKEHVSEAYFLFFSLSNWGMSVSCFSEYPAERPPASSM